MGPGSRVLCRSLVQGYYARILPRPSALQRTTIHSDRTGVVSRLNMKVRRGYKILILTRRENFWLVATTHSPFLSFLHLPSSRACLSRTAVILNLPKWTQSTHFSLTRATSTGRTPSSSPSSFLFHDDRFLCPCL
jgi:hypothetical protein